MILIVGKHFKGLRDYLQQVGIEQFLLCDEHVGEKHATTQGIDYKMCNFESRELIEASIKELEGKITAVVTIYENYVLPSAWIAESLHANGLPIVSAEACTDKDLMRQLFAQSEESISPDFTSVEDKEQLIAFADSHEFPLVLKPANLAKSLLVTTCNTKEELLKTYDSNCAEIDSIYKQYAPHRKPKLIVEEYLKGSVHSVDAFVDGNGEPHILEAIVDYQTGHDIGYNDNFHYSRVIPSNLTLEQQEKLTHVAKLGVKALKMKYSAAHIEIIMTANGPKIVEIGARNGGYRPRMHKLANDINIYEQIINTLTDQPIAAASSKHDGCAVLELFPKNPGTFTELHNIDELKRLESFTYLSLKVKPGVHVGLSSQGHKACAVIILHNASISQFKADLEYVNSNVYIKTD